MLESWCPPGAGLALARLHAAVLLTSWVLGLPSLAPCCCRVFLLIPQLALAWLHAAVRLSLLAAEQSLDGGAVCTSADDTVLSRL